METLTRQLAAERRARRQVDKTAQEALRALSETTQALQSLRAAHTRPDGFHDALTRLPNRAFFLESLQRAISRATRRPSYTFAVLLVDIDRFKIVNDSLGRVVGDDLISQIARRLGASLRREDSISRLGLSGVAEGSAPDEAIARMGGDEFGILVDEIKDPSNAARIAARIHQELAAPFLIGDHEMFAAASIGIVAGSSAYGRAEDVLRDADTAMHRAKMGGGARSELFDQGMHTLVVHRLKLETDLHHAVNRQEFVVHYQPIVSLRSGRMVSCEALVRWNRPAVGLVWPEDFISVAEETGMIVELGAWVLREACLQMKTWQRRFPDRPSVFVVSVNTCATQFAQPDLLDRIRVVLADTGLDPQHLRLEMTESLAMRDVERTQTTLSDLSRLGVRVGIDDFGTGYSSLSALHRFPVDMLKIDRSFVATMDCNQERREIVSTMITLARQLGVSVVAEGVETQEEARSLRALHCEFGQGYLFAKPMAPEEMEQLIASNLM